MYFTERVPVVVTLCTVAALVDVVVVTSTLCVATFVAPSRRVAVSSVKSENVGSAVVPSACGNSIVTDAFSLPDPLTVRLDDETPAT